MNMTGRERMLWLKQIVRIHKQEEELKEAELTKQLSIISDSNN